MTMENPVLTHLRAGRAVGCVWLSLGAPSVAELAAESAPDALVFDLQHGVWDRAALETAIGLTRGRATPLVRTASADPHAISTALDAGALGVLVPMVNNAADAVAAVAAAKYPPAGVRSAGGVRPTVDFKAYGAQANDAIAVIAMIETAEGVANAAAIARTPGIDGVFIGVNDLAMSLGTFPEFGPRHEAAVQSVLAACKSAKVPCGIFTFHATFATDRRAQGFQLVVTANDGDLLRSGVKAAQHVFGAPEPTGIKLDGAVALVSGTSRGIGRAIALALADAGAKKVYCGARKPEQIAALVAQRPKCFVPLQLDIDEHEKAPDIARQCSDVTLLVNNAGINFNLPLLGAPDIAKARLEIKTNYFSPLVMCRAFAPALKANGGGAIVNMLSILARVNLPLMGSLCASKAAALSMTQAVRAELKAQGTRVFAVMPGAVDTDMTRDFQGPKITVDAVAAAVIDGLRRGQEEIYPGDMAAGIAYGLTATPKATERELAQYLPA